ncbi:MAG: branched-chain amino acid ABC transporter permease [Nitrospinota bacterium]
MGGGSAPRPRPGGAPGSGASRHYLFLINMAAIYAILTLSLNFILGYLGLISIGHAGFFAIGSYVSAALTLGLGAHFLVGLLGAALASMLAGFLLGFPALRLKGHYFVLVTLGFGEIVRLVLLNWKEVTRGTDGVIGIPPPTFGPWAIDTSAKFYYFSLVFVALTVLITHRLYRSKFGRSFVALKDAELAAEVVGVDAARVKLLAFGMSAFIAGIAGSLYAHFTSFISPEVYTIDVSVIILLMLLVGGSGTISGCLVGAALLTFLPEWLRFLKEYYLILYGMGIVLIMVFLPDGIVGLARRLGLRGASAALAGREGP